MQTAAVLSSFGRVAPALDLTLSRRVEAAEAANVLSSASARASWRGDFEAEHTNIGGGLAIFGGYWTHLTHALSFPKNLSNADLLRVRRFFEKRYAPPQVRLSSLQPELVDAFLYQGYRQTCKALVMVRHLDSDMVPHAAAVTIRTGATDPDHAWLQASARGFCDREEVSDDELQIGATLALMPEAVRFAVSSAAGDLCSTASLALRDGVAMLFGDSTRVAWRGLGLQRSMIASRLAYAAAAGCDIAVAEVQEGSGSAHNYLRCGFEPAYKRLTLQLN